MLLGNFEILIGSVNINFFVILLFSLCVILCDQYNIFCKDISFNVLCVLYWLCDFGFGVYLVGGVVCDLLVNGSFKDFDVVIDVMFEQVKQLFCNCWLIGCCFCLVYVVFGCEIIEVVIFCVNIDDGSGDCEMENGMLVCDNVYGSIEDDVICCDFICNVLYYVIEDFLVCDYIGGFEDVQVCLMKLIGDFEQCYQEDLVCMLCVVCLVVKFGFQIEDVIVELLLCLVNLLFEVVLVCLFEEVLKLFLFGYGVVSFEGLECYGLLQVMFLESVAVLCSNCSGVLCWMVIEGLYNIDLCVVNDELVLLLFLFVLLLWLVFCCVLVILQKQGVVLEEVQCCVVDCVILYQFIIIVLLCWFLLLMQEIWLLQGCFSLCQCKCVFCILIYLCFCVVFDFLVLCQVVFSEYQVDVEFWCEVQQQFGYELDFMFDVVYVDVELDGEDGVLCKCCCCCCWFVGGFVVSE